MHNTAHTYRFIIILASVAALLLSIASEGLKKRQEFNKQLDTKINILKSVGLKVNSMTEDDIEDAYNNNISERFLSKDGDLINDISERKIFIFGRSDQPKGIIIPISGKGLWSTIYGFIALEPDRNTIKGITFYSHGETPGLGGEIDKDWFMDQFLGKQIFDDKFELVSVSIAKGKLIHKNAHEVDGISGATLTTKGMNEFILDDLKTYKNFLLMNKNIRK